MKKLICIIFVIIAFSIPAFSADYYIDLDAGTNGSGTFASPYNTWTGITPTAGNNYRSKCGTTYTNSSGFAVTASGTSGNHILFGAYYNNGGSPVHEDDNPSMGSLCGNGDAKPIFSTVTKGVGSGIYTLDTGADQYVDFNSISAQKGGAALNVRAANYVTAKYCYFYNSQRGIWNGSDSNGSSYNTYEYNVIDLNHTTEDESSETLEGIQFQYGHDNVARYTTITSYDHGGVKWHQTSANYNNTVEYMHISGGGLNTEDACLMFNPQTHDNVARYIRCDDAGQAIEINGSSSNKVSYVVANGNPPNAGQAMIGIIPNSSYSRGTNNNYIANSVFYDDSGASTNYGFGIYIKPGETYGVSGNTFVNNIIQKTGSSGRCIYVTDTVGGLLGTNYFYNNSCYEYGTNLYARIGGTSYSTAAAFNARADASGNIDTDPSMTDPDNGNFTLQAGSPAIDTGATINQLYKDALNSATTYPISVVTSDQDLQGTGWEIGAFAYTGATITGTTTTNDLAPPKGLSISIGN